MYLLFAIAAAAFAYGVYQHYRLITIGRPEARFDGTGERLKGLMTNALVQARGLRDRYSGSSHLLFFWGFVLLFFGTVVVFLQADLAIPIMRGQFYLYFESMTLNIVGLLGIIGLSMALLKRYVVRSERLVNPPRHRSLLDDGLVLGLFLTILITGFILQGLRIAATHDPWANWSPVGSAVASALLGVGVRGEALNTAHRVLWWFHMLLAFAFIAYIPYSKLRHLLLSPAAIYFRTLRPMGALQPIDMEKAETLGTAKFEDFTWKQILDTLACTECGRCQEACPAYAAGQPLSPKGLILDLRNALYRSKSALSPTGIGNLSLVLSRPAVSKEVEAPALSAAGAEAIWSCVTCGACMQQCPIYVEHVPAIVDLRRYMVMEQAEYPELMQEALGSMEARGHPFRGTTASRTDWCEGLDVKVVAESGRPEWLYWVGCSAAFDARNQKIARAFATVLSRAGVDFAILGEEERCTGDAARRIGNEYLYQTMVQANLETLESYGIQKIVTTCPHCFNTLKNEYPQFGGHFEVWHHTQLIDKLVEGGKLRPGGADTQSVTFHDSCYLARYNRVSDAPRRIIASMGGIRLVEPSRRREETFCCGGGGGHVWFEESRGKRINQERTMQLLDTGASAVASVCPFCMTMLSDGVKSQGVDVPVLDVAELVEQATRPA